MLIRRTEPDLIQPAKASEGDAAVALDRHALDSSRERRGRRWKARARHQETSDDPTTTLATVYTPEGYVNDAQERHATHTIDFTA